MHPLGTLIVRGGYTPQQSEYMTNYLLSVADYRYRLYLDLLVSVKETPRDSWPVPPWDVALLMHAHLLSPVKFANDIASNPRYSALAGKIDLPLMKLGDRLQNLSSPSYSYEGGTWNALYRGNPFHLLQFLSVDGSFPPMMAIASPFVNPKRFKFDPPPPFSLDLVAAVKRQIGFARKITSVYPRDPVPETMLLDSQQRYAKFMNLIRLGGVANPVPALDVDLFWHTHQLHATNYLPWCRHHVGRGINHDDTVGAGSLASGLDETITAWESAYFEDYMNPGPGSGPTFQTAAPAAPSREPSTADKTPPPGLTEAQLRLWNFDVAQQIQHERMDFTRRQYQDRLHVLDEQIAQLPPDTSSGGGGGGGGFLKRMVKAAVPNTGRRHGLVVNRNAAASSLDKHVRFNDEMRQAWGRQRWPLLVAARGFGDPTVTAGKYVRPPQGTADLRFPVYVATWYDDKQLGYYDYVTGGRAGSGAIEGGGVRVGGAMCGGRFDGGNCVAAVVYPNTNPGCSGGGGGG